MSTDPIRFRLSVLITAVGVILAIGHFLFPSVAIDGITVTLLLAAIAPWLGHVFKAFEVPGLGRVEYPDLKRTEDEVKRVGLTAAATSKQTDALPPSAKADPLMALVGLRIELEKRLRTLADQSGIRLGNRPGSIGMLARELGSSGVITPAQASALADMANTLNLAAHARPVDPATGDWALTIGPSVLASLDQKISTVASSNSATE